VARLDPTYLAFIIVNRFADDVRDRAVKGVGALAPHCKDLGTEFGLQQKKGCNVKQTTRLRSSAQLSGCCEEHNSCENHKCYVIGVLAGGVTIET
jgi:hypothetical protein